MPKTNHEFVAGQNSMPGHSNPYPRDSGEARAWQLGRNTPKPGKPTWDQTVSLIASKGLQGHNAKELLFGSGLSQL